MIKDIFNKDFEKSLKEINKKQTVPMENIFKPDFLKKYTNFNNFEEFIGPLNIQTNEDFDKFPEDDLDKYVRNHSSFNSWEEMFEEAASSYLIEQLGL